MGVIISRGQTFLGVPLLKVRNVLRAWRYGSSEDAHEIGIRKDVSLDPRTVMVLIEELRDRGFIGPEEQEYGEPRDGLTGKGLALAGAGGKKRTPKDRARTVLQSLLTASSAVNSREDLPFNVQQIWLFGSMINPAKADVGDIDLVLTTGWKEGFDGHTAAQRMDEIAVQMAGPEILNGGGMFRMFRGTQYVINQLLHGGRKHPLLSLNEMHELRDMACPCQLIFDASRGGAVDDPVLPKHPDSQGRSDKIGDPRSMPDPLEGRQPLRPLAANLIDPRSFHWRTLQDVEIWPREDAWYRIAQGAINGISVDVGAGLPNKVKANVVTKRLSLAGCDPRARVGLVIAEYTRPDSDRIWHSVPVPRFGIILERTIEESETGVTYHAHIADGENRGRSVDLEDFSGAQWWIYLMVSADIERVLRRDTESNQSRSIHLKVSGHIDKPVADELASWFEPRAEALVERTRHRIGVPSSEAAA
ncbi:hypothetical protein [Microvirga lotononidis]|uniref:Uncharacterized protein n=1 Tax=Microvirga lotononidis TaxID=864069 RepID=I4YRT9_9HYPH|nr:hypothetical protein [Microvirga lotononidis]EIM26681.1 hypothetical protein MicloDRAFT_00032310 [Microvirga lotononidis]WQO32089.1 hypothetical protein U0023_35405 [Microvirga lotononidis]